MEQVLAQVVSRNRASAMKAVEHAPANPSRSHCNPCDNNWLWISHRPNYRSDVFSVRLMSPFDCHAHTCVRFFVAHTEIPRFLVFSLFLQFYSVRAPCHKCKSLKRLWLTWAALKRARFYSRPHGPERLHVFAFRLLLSVCVCASVFFHYAL